ncbi:MAG: cytochrome c [Bacteroidota bacterium]
MQYRSTKHTLMFAALLGLAAMFGFTACGNSSDNKKPLTENTEAVKEAPVYGKIKQVAMDAQVNQQLAKKGEKIFTVICSACHKYDERYVGPALGTVYKRRTPVYIMNMILDTEVMLEKDDSARCLLQTYLVKMPNAQVNEADARTVLEHLRVISSTR